MIGEMRHRLTLQTRLRTADGAGGFTESWQDAAENPQVWAAIETVGAGESVSHRKTGMTATHRIFLYYRADITADMRLTDGSVAYDIVAVLDRGMRKEYLEVVATRES